MAKKYAYTFKEIAEEVMRKLPGHYKNFDSANATVRAMARALNINDINGKSHNKIVPAVHADIILKTVIEKATSRPYTPSTPIESYIQEAEKKEPAIVSEPPTLPIKQEEPQAVTSEQIDVALPLKSFGFPEPERVTPSDKKVDEFEARRKNFYTDVNYFLKYAQSKDERVAIWGALSKLYGITALPARRIEEAKPETTEQRDKWSI